MKICSFSMLACALLMLCALPATAFADTIEPNTHSIEKCVKITGLDAYPGYTFIGVAGFITSSNTAPTLVQIAEGQCIDAGAHYKFDPFAVYYANKSYIDKVGLSGIKTGTVNQDGTRQGLDDENLIKVGGDSVSHPYGPYYVSDIDFLSKSVTIEYKLECTSRATEACFVAPCPSELTGCNLTKVNEEKSGQPLGQPDNDTPPAPPGNEPPKPNMPLPPNWNSNPFMNFVCWLMGIFGQKC